MLRVNRKTLTSIQEVEDDYKSDPEIIDEENFEEAVDESKKILKMIVRQTNESENLRGRLRALNKIWQSVMIWLNIQSESETEMGKKNEKIFDPYIKLRLYGLPNKLPFVFVTQEIIKQINCNGMTVDELNRVFKKYNWSVPKGIWIVKLPRFIGKRLIEAKHIMVLNFKIYVQQHSETIQCYRCWRFGHLDQICKRALRCRICAGFHHETLCNEKIIRCVNCTDKGLTERETLHLVNTLQCKLFRKRYETNTNDRLVDDEIIIL